MMFRFEDSQIILGTIGLLIVAGVISIILTLCVSLLLRLKNKKTRRPAKLMLTVSFLAVIIYFVYQIFLSYYYRIVGEELIASFVDVDKELSAKESALRFISQTFGDKIDTTNNMPSVATSSLMIRGAMEKHELLTSLASLHPSTSTSPIIVNMFIFPLIKTEIKDDGLYLVFHFSGNTRLFPGISYRFRANKDYLFMSKDDAIKIFNEKYKDVSMLGGKLCPSEENYMYIIVDRDPKDCHPLSDKSIMEYLIKPRDTLWILRDTGYVQSLISPKKYWLQNNTLFGLMGMISEITGITPEKIEGDILLVNFEQNIPESKIDFRVYYSFEIDGIDNGFILDDGEIVKPSEIDNVGEDAGLLAGLFADMFYMSFDLTEELKNKLTAAKKMTIHIKKKDTEKYVGFDIPLNTFGEASNGLVVTKEAYLQQFSLSQTGDTAGFKISDEMQAKYPELIQLILATGSMDDAERQYWFYIMPSMTNAQIDRLFNILETERKKLQALELEWKKIRELNEKHLNEWEEYMKQQEANEKKSNDAKHQ